MSGAKKGGVALNPSEGSNTVRAPPDKHARTVLFFPPAGIGGRLAHFGKKIEKFIPGIDEDEGAAALTMNLQI